MWGVATNARIQIHPTAEKGWAVADDGQSYEVMWFEGPHAGRVGGRRGRRERRRDG